jgi:hypothetical protein
MSQAHVQAVAFYNSDFLSARAYQRAQSAKLECTIVDLVRSEVSNQHIWKGAAVHSNFGKKQSEFTESKTGYVFR